MGACIWLTGLSGAGKSTTAAAIVEMLSRQGVEARLLDGDDLRRTLSSDLGFSADDRHTHILRVAALAKHVVDAGGMAVCALVSPYRRSREAARECIGRHRFMEVFVNTPLAVCEARDTKGLYARARRGELRNLTGVDDVYEPPLSPDLIVTTTDCSPADAAAQAVALLLMRRMASSHTAV